jgi:hypothetical protein
MLVLYQVFTMTAPSLMDTIHGITFTFMLLHYQVFTTTVPSFMDTIHGITFTVNAGALPGFYHDSTKHHGYHPWCHLHC